MQWAGAHGIGTKNTSELRMNGRFRKMFSSPGTLNSGWLLNSVDISVSIASTSSWGSPSRLSKQVRGPEANSVERILEGVSHLSLTLVAHRADRRQERTQTMGFRIHPAVVAADQTHDVTRAEPEDVEVQTSARFENRFADLLKVNGVATHPVNEVFDLHHVAGQIQGWVVGDAVLDGPQEEACLGLRRRRSRSTR